MARFSPDGSRVVYRADQEVNEVFELYSVGITGGEVTKLNDELVLGGDVHEFAFPVDPERTLYFEQAGHQHAAAYLEELELTKSFDVMELFTPLA